MNDTSPAGTEEPALPSLAGLSLHHTAIPALKRWAIFRISVLLLRFVDKPDKHGIARIEPRTEWRERALEAVRHFARGWCIEGQRPGHKPAQGQRPGLPWSVFDFADRALGRRKGKPCQKPSANSVGATTVSSRKKPSALVLNGRSQGEVSRDLGVSAWSLGEWVKQAGARHASVAKPKTLDGRELPSSGSCAACAQEVDYLRQQRDILKKALGICSAEVPANVSR